MEGMIVKWICVTVIAVVLIVCITRVIVVTLTNCHHKKMIFDEREKKDALERLFLEKNRDEEIKVLKDRIKDLESKEAFLKKDLEIENLKFQKDVLEKNQKLAEN